MRQWADFAVVLPSGASVEIDVEEPGVLRLEIDVHRDAASLTQLSDALRAAVVAVDAQRAEVVS